MCTAFQRLARSFAFLAFAGAVVAGPLVASVDGQRAKPPAKPVAKPAAKPPAAKAPPRVIVAGIRVVAPGLGANGSELRAFNDEPGTALALAILAPPNTGLVVIDDDASRIDAMSDDTGASLLESGRFGPFPSLADDRSTGLIDLEVRSRPSAGATAITARGSIAVTMASGSKAERLRNLRLEAERSGRIGSTTITVGEVTSDEESVNVTLGMPRSFLNTIREVRIFNAKGTALEARRTGSGYFNEAANIDLSIKTTDRVVSVEFDLWQNLQQVQVPFDVTAGLGFAAGAPPTTTAMTPSTPGTPPPPAASGSRAAAPPQTPPAPGEGGATVEETLKSAQDAAAAANPRALLAMIYPDDRVVFAQTVAGLIALSPLANLNDTKAAERTGKDVDALFTKFKLTPPLTRDAADVFKGVDLPAFLTDSIAFLRKVLPKGEKIEGALPVPVGRLQNLKLNGDAAAGKVEGFDVEFQRVSGRWFLRVKP